MIRKEYPYDIDDVTSACDKTRQSIYNLSKQHRDFINDNTRIYQRRRLYNQAAMKFFTEYYGKATPQAASSEADVNQEATPAASTQPEIKALQEEIKRLHHLLEEKEAERKDLLQQNGALILTLQQEKQEKMMLLPGPRKGIGETIRGWFKKG